MGMFIDYDAQTVHDGIIEFIQEHIGEVLPEGDERRMFADAMTAYLIAVMADVEDVAKQKMLAYARGEVLDGIGEMYGCARIEAQRASCMLRFSLDEPEVDDIDIPLNTVCSTASGIEFATTERGTIMAGDLTADIPAMAVEAGSGSNGFVPGSVKIIGTAVAGVTSVTNVDATSGGSDGEADDDEGNASYRARILQAQNAVNTAGTASGYSYYARQADPTIADVSVPEQDTEYIVKIYVVGKGGVQLADEDLQAVKAVCAADDVRPLGDKVEVLNAERVEYTIDLSYTCSAEAEASVVSAVEGDGGAIDQYVEWQDESIGRGIKPQKLMALCFAAGADTVQVNSPESASVSDSQVAKCTSRTAAHEAVV